MKLHRRNLILVLLLIFLLLNSTPQTGGKADQVVYTTVDLAPLWTTGVISDNVGGVRIVAIDLDHDGKVEIATCSNGYAYVLRFDDDYMESILWFSEYLACSGMNAADRDSDNIYELYIASTTGEVLVLDGATYQILESFIGAPSASIFDIAVDDVDGDGSYEIVLAWVNETRVFDAHTYALEWQAIGLGGDELAIENIDTDPIREIVVNGDPAHVLDASQKIEEWAYNGGFGSRMGVGDVDNDYMAEIAYVSTSNLYVLDADTMVIKWEINYYAVILCGIAVADVDGDGVSEVVTGDGQTGSIRGFRGSNGDELWVIPNPEPYASGLTVADVNDDGVNEILWGAGLMAYTSTGLFIGDWQNEIVMWRSDDLDRPLYVAAGDVDNDHHGEIVLISAHTSNTHRAGMISVYDGETHQIEWSILVSQLVWEIDYFAVGQLDEDLPLEILIGGGTLYSKMLRSYDGKTGLLEWQSPELGWITALEIKNIDEDPIEEVFVALESKNVQVYDGASNVLLWDSGLLDGYLVQDIAVGDLDGNAVADLVVLTVENVFVYEVGTWQEKFHRIFFNGVEVAIAEPDINGGGELLLATSSYTSGETLQAWDGVSYTVNWHYLIGEAAISELASVDLDQDGVQEYILMGNEGIAYDPKSLLWIGSRSSPQVWEYKNTGHWGTINSMAVYDVDNDGASEFLFGSSYLIQVNELFLSSRISNRTYLPFLKCACIPIYSDDFSNPASGWPIAYTDTALFEYNNGEYRILVRTTDWGAAARSGFQAADYIVGVDLRNVNNVYGSYGLAFGIAPDWSSLYTLEIYPHGWYAIYRFDPSQVVTLTTAYSPAINQGTASNHIEIERNGNVIRAFANGQLLTTIADGTYLGSRYVGLAVFSYYEPNVDIRFDNFVVKPISCSGFLAAVEELDELILPLDQPVIDLDLLSTDLSKNR